MSEDAEGYLQASHGTFDAMYVEFIKALLSKIKQLENEKTSQEKEIENLNIELNKTNDLHSQINQRQAALIINN